VPNLSSAGDQFVQELSQRHGVSTDAATHMLIAVYNGNGTMAQFSHPEFGGSGQWMRGGMTMVSDLFNSHLKSRVDNICNDISNSLAKDQLFTPSGSFQSQSQGGGGQTSNAQSQATGSGQSHCSLFAPDPQANWWPQELGLPSATGSQNNTRYAYFANANRLAVKTGGDVWVYDTLNHHIGGFSQQQSGGSSITFSSQFGTVNLASLPVVTRNGIPQAEPVTPQETDASRPTVQPASQSDSPPASIGSDSPHSATQVLETLEKLGGLLDKGYITPEEFAAKKADLLSRL
jgi:hypothetical protein